MASLRQFTGGLQTTTSSFLQKDDQLALSINVHGDNVGSLTKRPGYGPLGSAGSSPVYGLKSYADITGGTTRLFRGLGGNVDYWNGSAWTNVTTYTPVAAKLRMTVFLDQTFIVGANASNDFITPINIDGVTATTTTNLTLAPSAKYCAVFLDQIYFANLKAGGIRFPSRLQYSSLPDAAATAITWPGTNYENIMTNNGEEITAIHTNKALGQLLLFKSTSLHAWDGYRIRDIANIGTDNDLSVVTLNAMTYFFAAGRGIYGYVGAQPVLISRGIKKWIKGIVDVSKVHATGEDDIIYKLYVGDILVDGKTYRNCEIRYSVPDNAFTVYSYHDDFTIYAEHKISGVTRNYAGAADGGVHQLASDTDEVYADDGQPIAAEFMTKPMDINQPENRKFSDRAVIFTTKPQNLQGRMRVRGGDWKGWFSINKLEETINLNSPDSHFIQFHFSESSTTESFQFEGLDFTGGATSRYV